MCVPTHSLFLSPFPTQHLFFFQSLHFSNWCYDHQVAGSTLFDICVSLFLFVLHCSVVYFCFFILLAFLFVTSVSAPSFPPSTRFLGDPQGCDIFFSESHEAHLSSVWGDQQINMDEDFTLQLCCGRTANYCTCCMLCYKTILQHLIEADILYLVLFIYIVIFKVKHL